VSVKAPIGSWIKSEITLSMFNPALESWISKYAPILRMRFIKYDSSYARGGVGKVGELNF
jgi:hypothetical protein